VIFEILALAVTFFAGVVAGVGGFAVFVVAKWSRE